jgi:hypothetical protein
VTNLPTAAEVLNEAIVLARGLTSGPHDFDRARLLLDIARELRVGSVSRSIEPEPLAGNDYAGEMAHDRVERIMRESYPFDPSVTWAPPAPSDATQVFGEMPTQMITLDDLPRWVEGADSVCLHCRERIEFGRLMGYTQADPIWRHSLTQQAVCPAPGRGLASRDGQPHTFAEPIGEGS